MKTVAMAILEQLAAWGVKYIYGYVDSISNGCLGQAESDSVYRC